MTTIDRFRLAIRWGYRLARESASSPDWSVAPDVWRGMGRLQHVGVILGVLAGCVRG